MGVEENAFADIGNLIARGVGVEEGMAAMLEHCRSRKRNVAWGRIGKLEFAADLARLSRWLAGVMTAQPPADDIGSLWFGLFNPADEAGNATSGLYVAGTTRFHTIKSNPDWNVRPEYWPDGRYAHSAVLHDIYRIAGNISGAEYALCPTYAGVAVAQLARSLDPKLLRGSAASGRSSSASTRATMSSSAPSRKTFSILLSISRGKHDASMIAQRHQLVLPNPYR